MKACRQNLKVENLSVTGEFNTAFELLQRLRQHYYTVNDITKAKHMLHYHALTQHESESGVSLSPPAGIINPPTAQTGSQQ